MPGIPTGSWSGPGKLVFCGALDEDSRGEVGNHPGKGRPVGEHQFTPQPPHLPSGTPHWGKPGTVTCRWQTSFLLEALLF